MATATRKRRTASQLAADGFAAMVQELGMADAVRYVQLFQQGTGDYTSERHEWLDEASHDLADLMAKIKRKSPRKAKSAKVKEVGR